MPLSPESFALAQDWLIYAKSDLLLAAIEPPEGVLLDALCYHAQQAAEKALKAVLVANNKDFPPTHNLVILRDLAGDICELPAEAEALPELSVYAVSSRYPEDAEPVTDKDEVDRAVSLAKATLSWAQDHIDTVASEDGHADEENE